MSQNGTADVFRRKLEESRAVERSRAYSMEFAGFPCKVLPLSLLHFIRAGRVPEYLVNRMLEESPANGDGAPPPPEPTGAQIVESELFWRGAFCEVMVSPPVVETGPVPEGGYLFAEIDKAAPRFVKAVVAWIKQGCPAPKEEKGVGVLGVEDLERFPDGAQGQSSPDVGDTREGVRATTVRANAPNRKRPRRKRL